MKSKDNLAGEILKVMLASNALEARPMTEEQLGGMFGVSRSPVRDALKELEKENVIERKKRKGVYLKPPSLDEILAAYDVRSVLEGLAARLAAERIKPAEITKLRSLARKYTQLREKEDFTRASQADFAFHLTIVKLAVNPFLAKIMNTFDVLEQTFKKGRAKSFFTKRNSPYPHERIVEALKKRDAEECEKMARSHIQWSKQTLLEESLGVKLNRFE